MSYELCVTRFRLHKKFICVILIIGEKCLKKINKERRDQKFGRGLKVSNIKIGGVIMRKTTFEALVAHSRHDTQVLSADDADTTSISADTAADTAIQRTRK